jgi:hypothetical protein
MGKKSIVYTYFFKKSKIEEKSTGVLSDSLGCQKSRLPAN